MKKIASIACLFFSIAGMAFGQNTPQLGAAEAKSSTPVVNSSNATLSTTFSGPSDSLQIVKTPVNPPLDATPILSETSSPVSGNGKSAPGKSVEEEENHLEGEKLDKNNTQKAKNTVK